MATIIYRIRGKSSIYISLTAGRGVKLETNTGFRVSPKDWSKISNKPKQNSETNRKIFAALSKLETFIYEQVNASQAQGELIDLHWLKENINQCFSRVKRTDHSLLLNHTQYIIDNANTRKVKGSNKIGLSYNRVAGYKSFKSIIQDYEKELKRKIHFQDVNKPFTERFTNWLMNTRKYSKNYAGKTLDNLKTVCLDAERHEINVNPYAKQIEGFKESKDERYIVTLSFEELEAIRTADLETEAQENARKWLLIGCEIGQRAGDLLKITQENIRYKAGRMFLDVEQQKTGKAVTVGIIAPHVIDILENDFPYAISQQKLNKHIKKVCKLAKIEEEITGRKFSKKEGRKILKKYPKWQLITSHSFRRSFATNYYKKIPTPVLIGITGHSKESMFLEYINRREDKDQNAELFMQFYESMQQEKEPKMKVIKNVSNQ